jgi:hypothetical protein
MAELVEHIPTAREQALYSPAVLAALDPSPGLPAEVRFALVTAERGARPYAYPDMAALARRIQRDRQADPIQMTPVRFRFRDGLRSAVRVTAEDFGGRVRLIGHAWISGRSWEALAEAIESVEGS